MNCPKCGAHISNFNLKPNCEQCGVNILLYTQEKSLEEDAKRTELEFASARIVLAKVKAAFIGGKLPIARLVFTLLCVAALLIPFADVNISTAAFSKDLSLSGLGVYNMFSDGTLNVLPSLMGSTLFGGATLKALISLGALLLLALSEVALLVSEILCFINIKKSSKAMSIISIISIALCLVFVIIALVAMSAAKANPFVTYKLGFGAFVTIVLFAVTFFINHKIYKEDLPLKLRPYDIERKETLKKIKSGEITFDDLPIPVFETDEEREARFKELEEMLKTEEEGV